MGVPSRAVGLTCLLAMLAWPAAGSVVIRGNDESNPFRAPRNPCPQHGPDAWCEAMASPWRVELAGTPDAFARETLTTKYKATDGWNFTYIADGAAGDLDGKYFVDFYRAYNECAPGLPVDLGVEIQVRFQADAGAAITDVLWIQMYHGLGPGAMAVRGVDDRDGLPAGDQAGTMPGPFYPFQDEDGPDGGWQSRNQYDEFYDKPGRVCPPPSDIFSRSFYAFAATWDDGFNADGTINDVGGNGHNITIYQGFRWGYIGECAAVPEPSSLALVMVGALAVRRRRRR